jgi:cardiolipin synthase
LSEYIEKYGFLLTIILFIAEILTIAYAIWRTQGAERTLAWIFAIIAFPGIGMILFYLLTYRPVKKLKKKKRKTGNIIRNLSKDKKFSKLVEKDDPLLLFVSNITGSQPTYGNKVLVLNESEEAFAKIESEIKGANESIWAEYYIIRRDETGHRFLNLLLEMARKGLEIKLIIDAVGSYSVDFRLIRAIRNAGGMIVYFNPLRLFPNKWSFHLRNHRKLILIDKKSGFTGGMNVGDEYSGRAMRKGKQYFKDTHLFIEGPAVKDLSMVFAEDWAFATGHFITQHNIKNKIAGNAIVSILPSGPDQIHNVSALSYFGLISHAKEKIYLTSPYFIPDEPIIRALETAALKGVDVRILVPAKSDIILAGVAARSYYTPLLQSGVKIFEYLPSMLHAKTMVVDSKWSIVGSANIDIRSFRLNFELNTLINDESIAGEIEKRFLNDLNKSRKINETSFFNRPKRIQVAEKVARLLSPLL